MLADDGFEDNYTIVTEKHTFTAPFVNAEETQYLCIEDHYTNGRPPLELGGVLYCDRETVDKIEKMKVCTCLNPLHTAMSIYGCMLGYTLISAEMADEDLRAFIQKIGYIEAMPVVVDPGVLNPYEFIGAVINRRLPNPFMPDAPQRIATDTSQKLAIRFGETIKAYEERGLDKSNLVLIPLVLAGYARYLKGIDDNGQPFEISPDPLLAELQAIVNPLEVKEGEQDFSCLKNLYSRADIFGVEESARQERIRKYADLFELTTDLAQPVAAYSHGMKQKLAIISAWLHEPKLILMDEPFVGLDPKASHILKGMMREVCDAGGAIFFSTHVLEVAEKLCDKVAIIKGGRLIRSGTMDEVRGDDSLEEVFLELEGESC